MGATFESCLPGPVRPWAALIDAAAAEFGVPRDTLAGLVMQESRGNAAASNFSRYRYAELQRQDADGTLPSGLRRAVDTGWTLRQLATSIGLAEVEGDTAWLDLRAHYPYADLFDPGLNLRLGAKYLSRMRRLFPGDWTTALAAYNAGPGAVQSGRAPASSFNVYAANIQRTAAQIRACTAGGA